jgi:hypothetical protein
MVGLIFMSFRNNTLKTTKIEKYELQGSDMILNIYGQLTGYWF